MKRGCRGRRAWCVASCVCVPEGLFFTLYIINHLLTVFTYPRTARTLVALTWRPLELAQSVWPQRRADSRCRAVSSDPGSLLAPYRPFDVTPPVLTTRAHSYWGGVSGVDVPNLRSRSMLGLKCWEWSMVRRRVLWLGVWSSFSMSTCSDPLHERCREPCCHHAPNVECTTTSRHVE